MAFQIGRCASLRVHVKLLRWKSQKFSLYPVAQKKFTVAVRKILRLGWLPSGFASLKTCTDWVQGGRAMDGAELWTEPLVWLRQKTYRESMLWDLLSLVCTSVCMCLWSSSSVVGNTSENAEVLPGGEREVKSQGVNPCLWMNSVSGNPFIKLGKRKRRVMELMCWYGEAFNNKCADCLVKNIFYLVLQVVIKHWVWVCNHMWWTPFGVGIFVHSFFFFFPP